MTTEELDALDAIVTKRDASIKQHRSARSKYAAARRQPNGTPNAVASVEYDRAIRRVRIDSRKAHDAIETNIVALIAQARLAESLRAKLIESETWRTELREEMDAVKGRLREMTGQRDELARAGKLCLSDGVSMNEAWTAMTKALEAAR